MTTLSFGILGMFAGDITNISCVFSGTMMCPMSVKGKTGIFVGKGIFTAHIRLIKQKRHIDFLAGGC